MIISVVIDPACFSRETVTDRGARFIAESFFESCLENLLLLWDEREKLFKSIEANLESIEQKHRTDLEILLAEVGRRKDSFFGLIEPSQLDGAPKLASIGDMLNADCIVCKCEEDTIRVRESLISDIEVVTFNEYLKSEAEKKRRKWTKTQNIDTLNMRQAAELITSAVRYSINLTFFDYAISTFAKHDAAEWEAEILARWVKGFVRVLEYCANNYPLQNRPTHNVTIFADISRPAKNKAEKVELARSIESRLKEVLIEAVKSSSISAKWNPVVVITEDTRPKKFLDRYLQADKRSWQVSHSTEPFGDLWAADSKRKHEGFKLHAEDQTTREKVNDIKLKVKRI